MPKSIFLDTNVFLDAYLPDDKKPCSLDLLNSIRMGKIEGFTCDYVLAEVLGKLKEEKEKKLGKSDGRVVIPPDDIKKW